jgi:hypothetical protein
MNYQQYIVETTNPYLSQWITNKKIIPVHIFRKTEHYTLTVNYITLQYYRMCEANDLIVHGPFQLIVSYTIYHPDDLIVTAVLNEKLEIDHAHKKTSFTISKILTSTTYKQEHIEDLYSYSPVKSLNEMKLITFSILVETTSLKKTDDYCKIFDDEQNFTVKL